MSRAATARSRRDLAARTGAAYNVLARRLPNDLDSAVSARGSGAPAGISSGVRVRVPTVKAYPLLLAAYPLLWIASVSTGRFFWSDLLQLMAASLVATALLLGVLSIVLRRRGADAAALVTAVAVCWFWGIGKGSATVYGLLGPTGGAAAMAAAGVGTVVGLLLLFRSRSRLKTASRAGLWVSALLVLQASAVLVTRQVHAARKVGASRLVREFAAPVPVRADAAANDTLRRDIYLIILDTYANRGVLRAVLGHDNTAFEDSLRALGFTIPRWSRSNYQETIISLPSIFNFGHVHTFRADGASGDDDTLPLYLMQHNRAGRFARGRGYRYLFFPSAWWRGTQDNAEADEVFRGWPVWSVNGILARTELRRVIWRETALRYVVPGDAAHDPSHIFATFEGLADVAARPEATFVIAHFLVPHLPYVLDADCRRAPAERVLATDELGEAAYVAQLVCVNRLLLRLARALIERSERTPVVLFQADHGTAFLNPRDMPPVLRQHLVERSGAFGAYLLPAGGEHLMRDSVSAVNVLRHVFRHYLGADLPPVSNDFFYADRLHEYDFTRYTTADLAP